jgi:hypothetical protein
VTPSSVDSVKERRIKPEASSSLLPPLFRLTPTRLVYFVITKFGLVLISSDVTSLDRFFISKGVCRLFDDRAKKSMMSGVVGQSVVWSKRPTQEQLRALMALSLEVSWLSKYDLTKKTTTRWGNERCINES